MKQFGKMRARIPWTHMIAKTIAHGERWLRGRGSCRHSSHVDTKLLKRAFNLMREMEEFNSDYQKWISQNERFKLKNYLLSSGESYA
jgi:outer membrane biogenesis lipoprotein LolB